jgi:exonuclease VII small subunit
MKRRWMMMNNKAEFLAITSSLKTMMQELETLEYEIHNALAELETAQVRCTRCADYLLELAKGIEDAAKESEITW